ncbi:gastrula zinc finger protein XlCGF57.1-like [Pimephales promelas]|nr:gastrula zinc finger protein XlCGF57.1-like [Pimephales promelas]KAG1960240.1 gastrula zinc finger protein XlCGF57.1-like [Pimephales promelas]
MAFLKEESGDIRIEETFIVKQEDTEEQTKMAFIKEESENMKIEETFRVKHEDTEEQTGEVITSLEFRTNLMLVKEFDTTRCPPKRGRPVLDTSLRLTARHFPSKVPQTIAQGSRTRRNCKVCLSSSRKTKKRSLTKYMCVPCNASLCVAPCFEEYHTLKNY